jgi:hypothetical protein
MASANNSNITRVPAGVITDEIAASWSSFEFTSSSASGSGDKSNIQTVVVMETVVDIDDNSGILIRHATRDDVLLSIRQIGMGRVITRVFAMQTCKNVCPSVQLQKQSFQ